MKKNILITILISALLLTPAAVFAETEAPSDAAGDNTAALQADITYDGNDQEGTCQEDIYEEADGIQEAVQLSDQASGEQTLKSQSLSDNELRLQETNGWNSDRTKYYENGVYKTGLFKAPMADGVGALFFADQEGNVLKDTQVITVDGTQTRFLRTEDAEGHFGFRPVPSSDNNPYSYLIGENGEGAIVETAGLWDVTDGSGNTQTYLILDNGTVCTTEGIVEAGGKLYCIGSGGVVVKGKTVTIGSKKYHVNSKGVVKTGRHTWKVKGKKKYYYSNKDGSLKTTAGFVSQDGDRFYVNKSGSIKVSKKFKIKSKYYIAKKNGTLRTGLFTYKKSKYYANKKGEITPNKKISYKNGKYYYITGKKGAILKNRKITYKKKTYIAKKSGALYTGFFKYKGDLYFASDKGVVRTTSGILQEGGHAYYVKSGGVIYRNKVFTEGGKKYVADSDGYLQTGLTKFKGNYYLINADYTVNTTEGIYKLDGKYYFNKSGGILAKNQFVNYGGKHYYAGPDAAFWTGTFKYDGKTIKAKKNGEISDKDYRKIFPDAD